MARALAFQALRALCGASFASVILTAAGGCREREEAAPKEKVRQPNSALVDVAQEAGVDYVQESGPTGKRLLPEIMGGGVALFDCDGDADLDLYFVNGNKVLPAVGDSTDTPNRLYRQDGPWRFVDVTASSGLGDGGFGMGVAVGDYDNDGLNDVYVTNLGESRLYHNKGNCQFAEVTKATGTSVTGWGVSAAFLDYDRDGFLDLYVTRYVNWNAGHSCFNPAGRPEYCGPTAFPPESDRLFHNNGDGTFSDVSQSSGIASISSSGLGVVCEDFNEDGWVDIYVANDHAENQMWSNQRDGTFVDRAIETGTAYNRNGHVEAGMGVIAADLDEDGFNDILLTHLTGETNTLHRNLGAVGGFVDASGESGLGFPSVPYTGFGVAAFDFELDGDLDVAVLNGRVKRGKPLEGCRLSPPWNELAEPNLFFRNTGDGTFRREVDIAPVLTSPLEVSRGLATGDIDQDGDLDLVVTHLQRPAQLLRNDAPLEGRFLLVRAIEPRFKRDAIGARIAVETDGRRWQRTVNPSWGYLSSSDPRVHFGLGRVGKVDRLVVRWPDGIKEVFDEPGIDRSITVERGKGRMEP